MASNGRNRSLKNRLQATEVQLQEHQSENTALVEKLQTREKEAAQRRQDIKALNAEAFCLRGEARSRQRAYEALENRLRQRVLIQGENARLRGCVNQLQQEKSALEECVLRLEITAGSHTAAENLVCDGNAGSDAAGSEKADEGDSTSSAPLTDAEWEYQEQRISMISHYILDLDVYLATGDVINLREHSGHSISQQQADYGWADGREGRRMVRRLYKIMHAGDEVCVIKRKRKTIVESKFGSPASDPQMRWAIEDERRGSLFPMGPFENSGPN